MVFAGLAYQLSSAVVAEVERGTARKSPGKAAESKALPPQEGTAILPRHR